MNCCHDSCKHKDECERLGIQLCEHVCNHRYTAITYRPDGNFKMCHKCGETGERVVDTATIDAAIAKVIKEYGPVLKKLASE